MDRQLQHYLHYVGSRFRLVRMGWLLSSLWILLTVLFFVRGSLPAEIADWIGYAWFAAPIVGVALWICNRFAFRDLTWLAQQVETRFPDLQQRLITASEPVDTSVSPFLRRSLIQETIQHARKHDWIETVPTARILFAWTAQLVCLLAACTASVYFASHKQSSQKPNAILGSGDSLPAITVEPGDAEVERGTDLVVTVRYGGDVPQDAWLVVESSEGSETKSEPSRTAMQSSLRDPVFGGYLRRIPADTKYRIESEQGTSETYTVKVFDYPALVRSDANISPPTYTNQPAKVVEDTRRVTVPEGTKLTWSCFVNKPLSQAELIDEEGNHVPLVASSEDPLRMTAAFEMDQSKKWKVRLVDSVQRETKFDETLTAKVIPNKEPELRLSNGGDVQASPLQELTLAATVKDDFQVTRSGITVTLGESEPAEFELKPIPTKGGKWDVSHVSDLEALGAKPDQLLSYFFWAEDLDRNGQSRRVDGEMFFAEIRPFEEIFREGDSPPPSESQQQQQQSQSGQQAEELAELQKQIISGTWNVLRRDTIKTLTPSFPTDVTVLSDSQGTALEKSQELQDKLKDETSLGYLREMQESMQKTIHLLQASAEQRSVPQLRDALAAERKSYEAILKLRAREHSIVKSQQQSRMSSSSAKQNRQQQIDQLKLNDDENKYESEQQASDESSDPQREARQVMNRLEELARRQKDLNEQLKELENALREAPNAEKKKEIEEQLARLREDQEEMIRDADELLEKMNEPENRQSMEEAREQVEQARQQLQTASESLSKQLTSQALNAGARAERQMEETREQLRRESSDQMQERMKHMLQEARSLEKKQNELQQKLSQDNNPTSPEPSTPSGQESESTLRPDSTSDSEIQPKQEWKDQKQKVDELLNQIKDTVSEAESSEPLLADELYEGFREAKQSGMEKQLEQIPLLLDRGFDSRAEQFSNEATKGIRRLRERIEKASESVLGSEQESLRRALREIDRAREELSQELDRNDPKSQNTAESKSSQPSKPTSHEDASPNSQQSETPGSQDPTGSNSPQSTPSENASNPAKAPPRQRSPAGGSPETDNEPQTPRLRSGGGGAEWRNESLENVAPLTGDEYRRWMDALRDVEELINDPERKADVARIREAAREMRVDYKRHAKNPQWDLVRKLIANPLERLRENVNDELMRLAAERNALVPMDRDPVPSQYQRRLDKYYENLGSDPKQ